jgi:hypothetical protein
MVDGRRRFSTSWIKASGVGSAVEHDEYGPRTARLFLRGRLSTLLAIDKHLTRAVH